MSASLLHVEEVSADLLEPTGGLVLDASEANAKDSGATAGRSKAERAALEEQAVAEEHAARSGGGANHIEEEDDFGFFDPSLFEPKQSDLVLETFALRDGLQPKLWVSKANTTDYHLTGTIVWPVSKYLAYYIDGNAALVKGNNVLELGAGCGLVGIVASLLGAAHTTISDGEELVVRIIDRNIETSSSAPGAVLRSALLRWGDDQETLRPFLERVPEIDVVLGADVFHPSFGEPAQVFELVRGLAGRRAITFVCGFVDRKNQDSVLDAAVDNGFAWSRVPAASFMPLAVGSLSHKELQLLVFSRPAADGST